MSPLLSQLAQNKGADKWIVIIGWINIPYYQELATGAKMLKRPLSNNKVVLGDIKFDILSNAI